MGFILVHKNNRGQLSIFLGITLILIMGMLAFVINVGLFVKAKINLQNAVDAAAYSGAATQARQLTNIAYVNWELRNTYKELMFKYYILGQVGSFDRQLRDLSGKGSVDYRLYVPNALNFNSSTTTTSVPVDAYNVPSICIHNNTSKNICPLYMIPGLPRYQAVGIASITNIHEALVTQLVKEKASDCSSRSNINYLAAMSWLYGSGLHELPGAPAIALNRPGAFPQSIELSMRIRNLEMILNRPPVTSGIDFNTALNLSSFGEEIALNERPYKAFMSAYRNLSGGKYKEPTKGERSNLDELSSNFKLYELPPQAYQTTSSTASGFLIPEDFTYPGAEGTKALTKYYVDLQATPVNLAVFYSMFTATKYKYDGVDADASCGVTKTAIPVPGYILGFTKNPSVLTYYAVKGESKFIGLFYPFTGALANGVTLTAYAAAKPFGGKIGPKLFEFSDGGSALKPRQDSNKKSKPYVSGLIAPTAGLPFKTGFPIPYEQNFWAANKTANLVIGGIPETNTNPSFVVPNMIYDFEDESDLSFQSESLDSIQDIDFNVNSLNPKEKLGLYNRVQLRSLKNSLGNISTGSLIRSDQVTNALIKARRPTKYDALNYLIPDYKEVATGQNMLPPMIKPITAVGQNSTRYRIFAPLIGPNTLYKNKTTSIRTVVVKYINASQTAVNTYLKTLLSVANQMYAMKTGDGTSQEFKDAALSIHANADGNTTTSNYLPRPLVEGNCPPANKMDIASKFSYFFNGSATACQVVPITELMREYIEKNSDPSSEADRYYYADYYIPGSGSNDNISPADIYTAYFPGKRQGASGDSNGTINHPFDLESGSYSGRRNFYSTKFIQLAKVIDSPPNPRGSTKGKTDYTDSPLLKEQASRYPDDLLGKVDILNPLKYDAQTGINNNYYLEF